MKIKKKSMSPLIHDFAPLPRFVEIIPEIFYLEINLAVSYLFQG